MHAAASLGIDFAKYDLDEPVDASKSQAIVSNVEAMARSAGPKWTRRMLLEQMVLGSRQAPWVGSAESIADALIDWNESAGIDGFNLSRTVVPECIDDVIELLVPVLQERGAYKTAYRRRHLSRKAVRPRAAAGVARSGAVSRRNLISSCSPPASAQG